jgi:hypothetical protein
VIDRVPVPKDAGIKVEVLDGATPPTEKDFDNNAGVYLWRLPGTPKAKPSHPRRPKAAPRLL